MVDWTSSADLWVEEGFTEELHASAVMVESAAKFINTKAFLQSFMHLTLFRSSSSGVVCGRAHRCKKNYKHLWFAIVVVFWQDTLLWLA